MRGEKVCVVALDLGLISLQQVVNDRFRPGIFVRWRTVLGRSATVAADRLPHSLSLGLFGHLQSIIHLNAKIAYGALQFSMTEEQLDSPQILCPSVNQRGLRPT